MYFGKAKQTSGKYFTRKSYNVRKAHYMYPRFKGEFYFSTCSSRSEFRKRLKKLSNKKLRQRKEIGNYGNYKKVFDLKRTLD